jgi:hypothetical protein
MELLGDRNWYLPTSLRWLPDIRVERAVRGEALDEDSHWQPWMAVTLTKERTKAP